MPTIPVTMYILQKKEQPPHHHRQTRELRRMNSVTIKIGPEIIREEIIIISTRFKVNWHGIIPDEQGTATHTHTHADAHTHIHFKVLQSNVG